MFYFLCYLAAIIIVIAISYKYGNQIYNSWTKFKNNMKDEAKNNYNEED